MHLAVLSVKRFFWAFLLLVMCLSANAQQPTGVPSIDLSEVKTLYATGQYTRVADFLTKYLNQNPTDHKARAVLFLALLRSDEDDLARAELDKMKTDENNPQALEYAKKLEALLVSKAQEKEKRREIYAALLNYDADRASSLIGELTSTDLHKAIMLAYIESYQGDFSKAAARLQAISPDSLTDKKILRQFAQQINEEQTEVNHLRSEIIGYLYSEVTATAWTFCGETKDSKPADFQHYVENVTKINTLIPLNPQVMDLVFHLTMISGDRKATETVGDKILGGKGNIRVPFLSTNSYFWLNIDARNKRLFTEPNSDQKFMVEWDSPPMSAADYTPVVNIFHSIGRNHKHSPRARWYRELEPFDLSFNEISAIEQEAKDWHNGLQAKAYALKLSPKGLAPNYVLMNIVACLFGEEAQRNATRNLGLFIQHVAAPHTIQATLVDPAKHSGGGGQLGSIMAGVYSTMAAQHGSALDQSLASMMSQEMARDEAAKEKSDQAQKNLRTKWITEIRAIIESFQDNQHMTEMEKLLQLQ